MKQKVSYTKRKTSSPKGTKSARGTTLIPVILQALKSA